MRRTSYALWILEKMKNIISSSEKLEISANQVACGDRYEYLFSVCEYPEEEEGKCYYKYKCYEITLSTKKHRIVVTYVLDLAHDTLYAKITNIDVSLYGEDNRLAVKLALGNEINIEAVIDPRAPHGIAIHPLRLFLNIFDAMRSGILVYEYGRVRYKSIYYLDDEKAIVRLFDDTQMIIDKNELYFYEDDDEYLVIDRRSPSDEVYADVSDADIIAEVI